MRNGPKVLWEMRKAWKLGKEWEKHFCENLWERLDKYLWEMGKGYKETCGKWERRDWGLTLFVEFGPLKTIKQLQEKIILFMSSLQFTPFNFH